MFRKLAVYEVGVSSSPSKWRPEPASGIDKFPSRHDWAPGLGILQASTSSERKMAEIKPLRLTPSGPIRRTVLRAGMTHKTVPCPALRERGGREGRGGGRDYYSWVTRLLGVLRM